MAKLDLTSLANLENETSAVGTLNENFNKIEQAMDNTLSRDGSEPNPMEAELDMNSNRILNLPLAASDLEPVRKREFDAAVFGSLGLHPDDKGLVVYDGVIAKTVDIAAGPNVIVSNADGTTGDPTIGIVSAPTGLTLDGNSNTFTNLPGMPEGGTEGYVLTKNSDEDFDTVWAPVEGSQATDITSVYNATSATSRILQDVINDRADIRDWGAKCDGTTDDTAAVQAALDECPAGETLWAPLSKKILISANGSQCLNLTRPVKLNGFYFITASGLSTSVDMLAVVPSTGNWYGWTMADCKFGDESAGRFGRHAIHIQPDATTHPIQNAVLERLKILNGASTVGNAIKVTNTGDTSGGWVSSTIRDCSYLAGGITFVQVGDRNTIDNCTLNPHNTGGSLVDLDFVSGAMNFQFIHNNCGSVSVFFRSGLNPYVAYNTFEQTIAGFQPFNTVVDFDGANDRINAPVVENNVFQMLNATPSVLVRFNNSDQGKLKGGNKLHMPTNAIPVIVTSNATGTYISKNQKTDSGTATWVSGVNYIAYHDKPITSRLVGDATTTISADTPDHTVALNSVLSADRTWTLPPLSHCFPGEEFVIQDLTNSLGTNKIVLSRNASPDVFAGGATTFNITSPGARVVLKADTVASIWHVSTLPQSVDADSAFTSNSDSKVATQKAVKTALDTKLNKSAYKLMFSGNSGATSIAGGETRYLVSSPFLTSESQVYVPVPVAGTFSNLTIVAVGAPGSGQTYTATVRKTLAATAITCTVSGTSTNTASDNTNTAHFNAGDRLAIQFVSSATAATFAMSYSLIFTPD